VPALQFSSLSPLKAAGGEAAQKRHKMAQIGVKTGPQRGHIEVKVSNISNFCETYCGNFFVPAQFCPQKALIRP